MVEESTAAFRYKWLLFSPNPGGLLAFENIDTWFTAADRVTVNAQIARLRDAIAAAPLDTGLRHLLLDCYYDLAVAEMQGAKNKLATLATKRLGLQLTSPFIIDDEIATYQELVAYGVLAKYAELLAYTTEGVDPADFDDRVPHGIPFPVSTREQPNRNSVATQYATATVTATVPDYDEATQSVVPRPENQVLFSGYKDYTTYLRIMADYVRYQAELARLRGMRQGPNDATTGRSALAKIMRETMLDFVLLRRALSGQSVSARRCQWRECRDQRRGNRHGRHRERARLSQRHRQRPRTGSELPPARAGIHHRRHALLRFLRHSPPAAQRP